VHSQGYELNAVVDRSGRPLYLETSQVLPKRRAGVVNLGPAFERSLRNVHERPHKDPLIAGYSRAGSTVYLFAVSKIQPLTEGLAKLGAPSRAMIIARRVDPAYLQAISDDPSHPNFRLGLAPNAQLTQVPLRAPSGEILAYLSWTPQRPGSALRRQMFPAFFLILLISIAVASVIVRRGRQSIEALKLSERRAQHLATHDPLTSLPNRRFVERKLQSRLDEGSKACILYMDLDGFKQTNDVYGHAAGDVLLAAVAARLRALSPEGTLLARMGGDEFAILLDADEGRARDVAQAILLAFSKAFMVHDYNVSLGVSIGLACGAAPLSCDELLRRADSAMYAAKANGKRAFHAYDPELDAGRKRRRQLESDLKAAIEQNEIGLVYQPIVCAKSREVLCVEALARWKHPELGLIPPDQFIPIAESSGHIVELGRAILTSACREVRDWNVDLAVNLSPAQFWDRDLPRAVAEVLDATNFPAERLELEVTEGYLMRRPEAAGEILKSIASLGVRIALDDFGTGYASIGYLRELGFNRIKIDRSFVAASLLDERDANLARAIVSLGDALSLPVTAEGVETLGQAKLMQRAGCARLQGWLFGKPMPASEMGSWLLAQYRWVG
jgi:diguanylate cyclase (GGDEF)-like protein